MTRSLLFLALLFPLISSAQVSITVASPSPTVNGRFGSSVASIGDIDDDGVPDALVGARGEALNGSSPASGRAHAVSGATGAIIRSFDPPSPAEDDQFGAAIDAAGDIDQDGNGDVLVGAPNTDGSIANEGRVYLFSGATSVLLQTYASPNPNLGGRFGRSVARIQDADGDGRPDVLIGAPGEDVSDGDAVFAGAGRAYVFSSVTGDLLATLEPSEPQVSLAFGGSVGGGNDYDDDGRADLLVGLPRFDVDLGAGALEDAGAVEVRSGADGSLLRQLTSPSPSTGARFGQSVTRIGDVDGDGTQDVLTGERGRAYLFSGATGAIIRQLANPTGNDEAEFGGAVAGAGDVDDDGQADIFVSAPTEDVENPFGPGIILDAGRAYVFSSATGAAIRQVDSMLPTTDGEFGAVATRIGDVNDDNEPDLLVGAPGEGGSGLEGGGNAYLILNPPPVATETAPTTGRALTASPNPARGSLRLGIEAGRTGTLTVVDAIGREVFRAEVQGAVSLNVSEWAPGVYLARFASDAGTVTRTVTVTH